MLTRKVESGELPPLSERLPASPLVARTDYDGYEEPGIYGGQWHRFHRSPSLGTWRMVAGYAPLIRWRFDCSGLDAGTAESWETSDDGTRLTIHLRKGVRWSDGHPFTSESFAFYYDLCLDERHSYSPPVWCLVDGKPMVVETPDEYTIVMTFAGPNWLVPLWLATGYWNSEKHNIPKHYMTQFHPDYSGYTNFNEFNDRNISYSSVDRPTLWPWRVVKYENGGDRVELERNPYYYVVDELGRQLPYIDRVKSLWAPDSQISALRVLAGDVDCQFRDLQLEDFALYVKGEKRGRYQVRQWKTGRGAEPAILLNWSDPDPVLRKLMRTQEFRQALALGVDRDKCNEIAWKGLLESQAATVSQASWHFRDQAGQELFEKWKRTYADFDIERGNRLLDQLGLAERNSKNIRLREDGEPLRIVVDVPSSKASRQENDIGLIIADGWRALGLEVILNTPPGAELNLRQVLGKYTVSMHDEAEMDLFTYPDWIFPISSKYWHPRVGKWYESGGAEGEPATGPLKELLDLYDAIKGERDLQKRHQYVRDAVQVHIDQGPFLLGTAARSPGLVVVKDRFHNVPQDGITGPWAIVNPATSYPEQYFISERDKSSRAE